MHADGRKALLDQVLADGHFGGLAAMVAHTATADLRGTTVGFFNLFSGLAMFAASVLAGILWDRLGASSTFLAGAIFCLIALGVLTR